MIVLDEDETAVVAEDSLPLTVATGTKTTLLSLEDAERRIGAKTLETLAKKFNGKLVEVRHPDERDHLF